MQHLERARWEKVLKEREEKKKVRHFVQRGEERRTRALEFLTTVTGFIRRSVSALRTTPAPQITFNTHSPVAPYFNHAPQL